MTSQPAPRRQRGAALITAMVILLIMTIIGITAISTTALEQKMAVNMQETNRAFQAAESGLSKAINTPEAFNLYVDYQKDYDFGDGQEQSTAAVSTEFKGWTQPKRGSGYSAIHFTTAHFEAASEATTLTGASAAAYQGLYQITPKLE